MRALETVSAEGLRPSPGKPVKLDWLPISALRVDDAYQRDTGKHGRVLVRKIMAQFQWRKFSPVIVAPVPGGVYAIIDGQHRSTAALSLGYEKVPCAIVQATPEEAAEIFAAVNGETIRINTFSLFKAALAARVGWAVSLQQTCTAHGITPLTYPVPAQEQKPYMTNAIAALKRIVELHGAAALTATITIIKAQPNSAVPGFINSARIKEALHTLTQQSGWMKDPVKAVAPLVQGLSREVAAPLPAAPAIPASGKLVTPEDAEARAKVQDLKARGFNKSMVAAVTRYRHALVEKFWEASADGAP